jgi:hypothetical protein
VLEQSIFRQVVIDFLQRTYQVPEKSASWVRLQEAENIPSYAPMASNTRFSLRKGLRLRA